MKSFLILHSFLIAFAFAGFHSGGGKQGDLTTADADDAYLNESLNLSDLDSNATSQTNMDVPSIASAGDLDGPASAVTDSVATYFDTSGKTVKNNARMSIPDAGNIDLDGVDLIGPTTGNAGEFGLGSQVNAITDFFFGEGVGTASPQTITLCGSPGAGLNISASTAHLIIAPPAGSGNGAGGHLQFNSAPAGASGSSTNAGVLRMEIPDDGTVKFLTNIDMAGKDILSATVFHISASGDTNQLVLNVDGSTSIGDGPLTVFQDLTNRFDIFSNATTNTVGLIMRQKGGSLGNVLISSNSANGAGDVKISLGGVVNFPTNSNIEQGSWGWDTGDSQYQLATVAFGTGAVQPMAILTGANSNQIRLNVDGTVDMVTGDLDLTEQLLVDGVQVVNNRVTGWTAATGAATRTTFVTSTVTLEQLAERVKALIDDGIAHGLIGS